MADNSIALQVQTPDSFKKIGEIINFARGATELQKSRATMAAEIERAKAESSSAQTKASYDTQTLAPKVEQQAAQTGLAKTQAADAQWKLDSQQAGKLYELAAGIAQDPAVVRGDSAGSVAALMRAEELARAHKIPEDKIRVQFGPMYGMAAHNPAALRQAMDNIVRGQSGTAAQAGVINAPLTALGTGAETQFRQLQPGAQGAQQPGSAITQELPPTTPVFNTDTNAPGYLGARKITGNAPDEATAVQMVQDASRRGQKATIQSGPALGAQTTEEGKSQLVNSHFNETAGNAASSSLLEGIAQNIKTYGARAIVGTEQEKLAFLNGLLEKIGIPGANDLKTATDLMEKNMAQLAKNSPAATDAARVVNQLASPHPTMNAAAIAEAADQIIGQVRMSRDVYKTFLPLRLKSDNAEYLKKLGEFADVSDARVWQFEALGPAERAVMVAKMKPEDREAFKKKIEKAEKMGFFK